MDYYSMSHDEFTDHAEGKLKEQKEMLRIELRNVCDFPDWAADEVVDLAYHAADSALLSAIRIIRGASADQVAETAFSIALTLIGTAADGGIEMLKARADRLGHKLHRVPNETAA